VLAGLLKAVRTARHFIYIEDQYFFFVQELYDELRAALRSRVSHLFLLVQYPPELPGFTTLLWKFWMPLHQEFPERVHAFYRRGGVYIHSKTKLIDDVWTMVGSANINYRSSTSDPEIVATAVDRSTVVTADGLTVSRLTHEWRCDLWEDATGIPAAVWRNTTIDAAVGLWRDAARAPANTSKIGAFSWTWGASGNVPEYEAWADEPAFIEGADPDSRCSASVERGGS